ncbi:MAG: ABC transporter ATP-binding protein, partial [Gemmatimonadaceae bacterium]
RMSVVLQDTVLFGLTVRENLALGAASPDDAAMQAAAHAARIDNFIDRLPRGYDTPVRQRGALFSSGERQRLAIARALLRAGSVWLLDDPLAGLDVLTSRALADVLLERTAGRTTLWVTHDPDIMARMDWVLSLKAGRVAFSGTPEAHTYWTAQRTRAAALAHSAITQEL